MRKMITSKSSRKAKISDSELFGAVMSGDFSLVKRLVEQGGNVNHRKGHFTPLMYAVGNANSKIASYLIKCGADVNARNDIGQTPLMIAATRGHKQIVEQLVHAGADTNIVDQEGRNAIAWAASRGDFADVISVLFTYGTNPNVSDKHGFTPLMRAAMLGHDDSVATLLTINADATVKFKGKTAYQMAEEKGHKKVCETMKTILQATSKERWRKEEKAVSLRA